MVNTSTIMAGTTSRAPLTVAQYSGEMSLACHPIVEPSYRDDSKVYECIVAIIVLATDRMIMKLDTA